MLDGVDVYGHLHRQRLFDGFYRRSGIMFQAIVTLASAMMRPENQEAVIKQIKKLGLLIYPEDSEARQKQEEAMKDVLRREGQKSYKVRRINLGERSR